MSIKIIDLFAGPGGLGEGFSSLNEGSAFQIALSAEMEASAHATLTLRSFFRKIQGDQKALRAYYKFCESDKAPHPRELFSSAWQEAVSEARQITLGDPSHNLLFDELIDKAKLGQDNTILIGGPPCQAYSLVGRSRNMGKSDYVAEEDHRHFLYKEYLRILNRTKPAIFVMENVKGILSSKVGGKLVFHDILRDLTDPSRALKTKGGVRYTIHSLVSKVNFSHADDPEEIDASSFIIKSELFGIPQARHRVILLGVREDIGYDGRFLLDLDSELTVRDAIGDLPPLRSRLNKNDNDESWLNTVKKQALALSKDAQRKQLYLMANALKMSSDTLGHYLNVGGLRYEYLKKTNSRSKFKKWVEDSALAVTLNHETRSHMESDLARYFYSAVFTNLNGRSPKGHTEFNLKNLAPDHANWETGKFSDRFRVQRYEAPSTTVTSHISKDGHYFIHPDPSQCRSLTVREAARLQTFPDNYFFQGNRTQQYHQVGNAVPPMLASKIAGIVLKILGGKN